MSDVDTRPWTPGEDYPPSAHAQEMDDLREERLQGQGPRPEPASETGSVLARLSARRRELAGQHVLELDIPGYDGELVARYKVVPYETLKKLGARAQKDKDPRALVNAAADQIIHACDEILIRVGDDLRPVSTDGGGVRYDDRLAVALGIDYDEDRGARGVLMEVFATAPSPEAAVLAHSARVGQWMQGANRDADEELLGE